MTTRLDLLVAAPPASSVRIAPWLIWAAPLTAQLAGGAAEWLDFRALRYPLVAIVLAGVTLTRYAHDVPRPGRALRRRGAVDALLRTVLLGVITWGAAETVYVLLHAAQGERFEADRFGPQPAQALALIAAHGVFLGAPTGAVAWALLRGRTALLRRTGG
jgi:hypothetical protein